MREGTDVNSGKEKIEPKCFKNVGADVSENLKWSEIAVLDLCDWKTEEWRHIQHKYCALAHTSFVREAGWAWPTLIIQLYGQGSNFQKCHQVSESSQSGTAVLQETDTS